MAAATFLASYGLTVVMKVAQAGGPFREGMTPVMRSMSSGGTPISWVACSMKSGASFASFSRTALSAALFQTSAKRNEITATPSAGTAPSSPASPLGGALPGAARPEASGRPASHKTAAAAAVRTAVRPSVFHPHTFALMTSSPVKSQPARRGPGVMVL